MIDGEIPSSVLDKPRRESSGAPPALLDGRRGRSHPQALVGADLMSLMARAARAGGYNIAAKVPTPPRPRSTAASSLVDQRAGQDLARARTVIVELDLVSST